MSKEIILSCSALFPSKIGLHDPGRIGNSADTARFLKLTEHNTVPVTLIGAKLFLKRMVSFCHKFPKV